MCMSMTTPSLHVCPWAAWVVAANPGANGNCFRVTRSTGRFRPLSRYHGFFCGATGKTLSSSIPSTRQVVLVLNRTKMHAGNSFQICVASWLAPPTASACQTQPTISPAHPRKIPRVRSKWSAAATGIPMHSGKTPYKDPQSWSWRCSHVNFSLPRSGFSRKAALDILSFAMAWCSTCPVSAAQTLARSLFTWYFTAFVAKIAFAPANVAAAAREPSVTLALDWRSFLHMSHSKLRIASGAAFCLSNSWHVVWLHSSLCPFQLPGTGVGQPCKNAWFVSDNAPFRTSFCRLCNHISWVRSHSTSSVTPWIPSGVSPQTNSCPRMVWATFFVLHCVNHSHGTSPKKVPRGGGSCHISPARITFNPPKGRAYAASFAYLPWARSRTNSRQRNSNRANSSALTMLISSMMSHRQRNALALSSRSLCPLMRSSPRPCQFKPNAWWIVSPFKSWAITACSVTTWNSSPCFQPKISSNNSFRRRFNTYDFPVPGPPCTAHRNGSSTPRFSDKISCTTWLATFLQTSACLALHPSCATPPAHSSTWFLSAVILTISCCTSGSRTQLSFSQLTGRALHRTLFRRLLLSKPWHGFGNGQDSHGSVFQCFCARSMASTMRLRCTDHLPFGPTHSVGRGSRVPFASLNPPNVFSHRLTFAAALQTVLSRLSGAVCRPSIGSTLRSGPTQHCLVQTAQPSAVTLHTVLLKAQDFKPLNALQPPYTLSCWRFKATICEPPNSQPLTHCLVGAARVPAFKPLNAPQQPYTVFCWSFYSKLPLPAFKRVNPPQRPYTLYCWGVTPFAGLQTRTVRSGTTHSAVGGSRVPFASLQTFIQTVKPSAAALQTVLLRLQDHRLLAFNP